MKKNHIASQFLIKITNMETFEKRNNEITIPRGEDNYYHNNLLRSFSLKSPTKKKKAKPLHYLYAVIYNRVKFSY